LSKIGRRIYYELETGNIVLDTGESSGFVTERTVNQDFQEFTSLSQRNRECIGILSLEYGQYAQDFASCDGFRVNPQTGELEFSYPDPSQPEPQEPVYQKPLSEEVTDLKQAIAELTMLIATPTI